jgi:FMN reductase
VPDAPAVAGISGSPRSPSRSKALLEVLLEQFASQGCATQLIDLATLPPDALVARAEHADVSDAIAAVGEARIVVAATPTYRALYTGLLKCFFDLMPQSHLAGKLCLPLQTAAVPQHFLAIEYGLRPLFMSLDGVPLAGVFATDEEFVEGRPGESLSARVEALASATLALAQS